MNYDQLIQKIMEIHGGAYNRAAVAVNQALVLRNWMIGAQIVEFDQGGEDRAAYGEGLLDRVADDLAGKKLKGCSRDMLERMRQFYLVYPQLAGVISASPMRKSRKGLEAAKSDISASVMRKSTPKAPRPLPPEHVLAFSWTHLIELIRIEDPWKRAFYENECLRGGWSVRQFKRQIQSMLYERTGLSKDKQAVIERARRQGAEQALLATDMIRDPYVLEFAGVVEKPFYSEDDLETALLDHLQDFLLELGTGFCFEGRQFRITVGNEHDRIDLVFYQRRLRCHVLLDLKIRAFRHGDAGQMNFYLNYFKSHMMEAGDNPPVGIILCSDKDHTKVEYATAGMDNKLFVSRYLVALPSAEQLRELVEKDREQFEAKTGKDKAGRRSSAPTKGKH